MEPAFFRRVVVHAETTLRQEMEKSRPDLVLVNDLVSPGRYSGEYSA